MPLKSGPGSIGPNITELKRAGYPKKQRLAIALQKAGKVGILRRKDGGGSENIRGGRKSRG